MNHVTHDAWGHRERCLGIAIICFVIAAILLLALVDVTHAEPLAGGRTVTVTVPAGETLHAYPEADATAPVYVRCVGARTWRVLPDNGARVGCRKATLKSAQYFDWGFE